MDNRVLKYVKEESLIFEKSSVKNYWYLGQKKDMGCSISGVYTVQGRDSESWGTNLCNR